MARRTKNTHKFRKKGIAPATSWVQDYLTYDGILGRRLFGNEATVREAAGIMAYQVQLGRSQNRDCLAPRILLSGPVSTGKTTLASLLARELNLPFAVANGGLMTPAGYRGSNITDSLQVLLAAAGVNAKERLERSGGVLLIDEADKMLLRAGSDDFVSTIMFNLLSILGGEVVQVPTTENEDGITQLSTNRIIVIMAGVYKNIAPFAWKSRPQTIKAMLRAGYPEEILSRLTHFLTLKQPGKEDILKFVEGEINELRSLYQLGTGEMACKNTTSHMVKAILSQPLGLRHARSIIHKELFAIASESAIDRMFQ